MEDHEPNPKRSKLYRGDDDYMPGNITKVELCNFMSFDKLICKPCSRLNLVIGPNGAGKSSPVCAIALGLGGEPQVLGRAARIGAYGKFANTPYVKFGEESGYITICLRGETKDERITITRRIDVRNKSEWLFNGNVVTKNEIKEVIQRFNIQVSNLTQFLPQDRVCEFARLTPVQLLRETEKAVGDPQLPVEHETLVSKSQELKKLKRAIESSNVSLNQLEALHSVQEKDVKRFYQREELLEKAELMEKKLPWLEHEVKKAEYVEAKKQENDAKMRSKEANDCLEKLREPIEEKKGKKTAQEAKCIVTEGLLVENKKAREKILNDNMRLDVKIKIKCDDIKALKDQEKSRQERINNAEEELAAAELEAQIFLHMKPQTLSMAPLTDQIVEVEYIANEIGSQMVKKKEMLSQCSDRLKDLNDEMNRRLYILQERGAKHIFEAYRWVQKHSGEFKKKIFGPILLEVNVSRFQADYLEGQVAKYMWEAFITQDDDDRNKLVHHLQQYKVPVINQHFKGHHKEKFHPTSEMQELGISTRLDQVFEAPDVVRECLIKSFGLDTAYVGSKETDKQASQVPKLGIMNLWTPENHYSWSRSRYGNHHISASGYPVQKSKILLSGSDTREIEKCKLMEKELKDNTSTLEASLKDLQAAFTQKEDEKHGLYREREKIKKIAEGKEKKLREFDNRVDAKKRKLNSIKMENEPGRAAKLIGEVKELKIKRFQCALEIKNLLVEAVGYLRRLAEDRFCLVELDAKITEMESNVNRQVMLAKKASSKLERYARMTQHHKQQMLAAKKHAESIARITPELKLAFSEMPSTVEELRAAIQDTKYEANLILSLNANVVEEYKTRERQIKELKYTRETDKRDLKNLTHEIDSLKKSWLLKLRDLVRRINETFSLNFQEMAVAGEVSMDEHDMDFDRYGILIKVKFWQTGKLQVLNAHHQSGGERAVSTIVYLVSLQDITNCPFRVVDEINQGMDPINERKMFQQLVRAASKPNTPQCFLLTPKLLPNLEYSDACSILNVMKGPWLESPSKVWSSGGTWRSVRKVQMQDNSC